MSANQSAGSKFFPHCFFYYSFLSIHFKYMMFVLVSHYRKSVDFASKRRSPEIVFDILSIFEWLTSYTQLWNTTRSSVEWRMNLGPQMLSLDIMTFAFHNWFIAANAFVFCHKHNGNVQLYTNHTGGIISNF